ncbi:MAG TPA: hypothetical protein VIQ00_13800 [Chitinophagaceae bacterium]|jgi:hypothetical protein
MSSSPKIKFLIFLISILLITNIAMLVFFVWKKPIDQRDRGERRVSTSELLKTKIGFSETQMKEYDQLKQEHRESMRPLFDSIRIAKEDFYKQLNQPSVNDSVLNITAANIGKKQQMIDLQVFNHFRKVRGMCTGDQQPKFDSLINGIIQKMIVPWRRGDSSKEKKKEK